MRLERLVLKCSECRACDVKTYLWDLEDATLWPFSTLDSRKSLGAILEKLKPLTQRSADYYICSGCDPRKRMNPAFLDKQAKSTFKGACLGCFKRSYAGPELSCNDCEVRRRAESDYLKSPRKRLCI